MPDCHAGVGCVIGFTANLGNKIIPSLVGVDIGCGLRTYELGRADISLEKLEDIIQSLVPSGRDVHKEKIVEYDKLYDLYCLQNLKGLRIIELSLGTLGGGNHFTGSRNLGKQVADFYQNLAVELMEGKDKFFKMREEPVEEYKAIGRQPEIKKALKSLDRSFRPNSQDIPKGLCYLTGEYRENTLFDSP